MDNCNFVYNGKSKNNDYILILDDKKLCLKGKFYTIINREIKSVTENNIIFDLKDYLGSSNLKIRSEKKLNQILYPYLFLTIFKFLTDKILTIIGWRDDAESFLNGDTAALVSSWVIGFIGNFIPIPIPIDIFSIAFCITQILIIVLLIRFLVSKKDVYEFSFVNGRVAVDKDSMPEKVYLNIINKIKAEH